MTLELNSKNKNGEIRIDATENDDINKFISLCSDTTFKYLMKNKNTSYFFYIQGKCV